MGAIEGDARPRWIEGLDASLVMILAVVFAGQMIYGYALLDEILTLGLVGALAYTRRKDIDWARCIKPDTIHWGVFVCFIAYMEIESLRGLAVLGDWRMVRFVAMFFGLGLIAVVFRCEALRAKWRKRAAWYLAWAGAVYFIIYLLVGVVTEMAFGLDRFSLQGRIWSGTATAVFPAFVTWPAMMAVAKIGKPGRNIFWIGYALICTASFYYQSRSLWLLLMASLIIGFHVIGIRRVLLAGALFVAYIFIFPWDWAVPLNSGNLFDASRYSDNRMTLTCRKLGRFANSIAGGMVRDIDKRFLGCPEGEYRLLDGNWVYAPHEPSSGEPHEPSSGDVNRIAKPYVEEPAADIDRKIAVGAALSFLHNASFGTVLFGSGYYTHRYELVEPIQALASEYGYHFPAVYQRVVRTATLPGMAVDTGVIGIGLLFALVALTAIGLFDKGRMRSLPSLVGLGMVLISMAVSLNYDVILLYLALMPGGGFLGIFHMDEEDAGASTFLR